MAHLIRFEEHDGHRYRIVQSRQGFLLSFTIRDEAGRRIDAQEWLYRTREAAERGLAFMVLMNRWWDAVASGHPAGDLPEQCERAAHDYANAVTRLNDKPAVGPQSRETR